MSDVTIPILIFLGIAVYLVYYVYTEKNRNENEHQEQLALQKRYNDETAVLQELYEKSGVPSIGSDVVLKKDEVLYAKFSGSWNELRRHTTDVRYGGFSTRIRIVKGLSYRAGSYQVKRESEDIQTRIDSGDLYITNKAILFRGRLGNKTLQYNKISQVVLGLDGLTLERESGKSIFFACPQAKPQYLVALYLTWFNNRG